MMKILFYIIIFIVSFIAYARFMESKNIFFPYRGIADNPNNVGLAFEDIYFKTEDGIRLNGWFIRGKKNMPTLLFFHGNAGNMSGRLEKISLLHKMGLNIFIIDYRGYGNSEGKPTEDGLYKDAVASYDYLISRQDIDRNRIVVYGVSLGGVPAVDLATKRKIAGLIIDSSFTSAADMAKRIYPFIPSFIIKAKMDSAHKIKNVNIPKMIMHSVDDKVVPYSLGKKLYNVASEPKVFLEMRGGHNDNYVVDSTRFLGGIKDFLKSFNLI